MKKISGFCILFVLHLLIAGCATGPKFEEYSAKISDVPVGSGRIYIYRPSSFGFAITPNVVLNGAVVGESTAKGFFYVDRPPGAYKITTSTEVDRTLSLTLDEGQVRYVRLRISLGFFVGHVYPELVEPTVGQKEIECCSYTGAL